MNNSTCRFRDILICKVLPTAVLLILSTGFPYSTATAAPVTLQFDAEIVSIPVGNPFDLPFTYQLGDIIRGKFTFEPGSGTMLGDNAIVASQPFGLEFDINGTIVGTAGFKVEVFDNTMFTDSPFPGLVDVINLGCTEPACNPELIDLPDGEPFRARSRMQLIGNGSVFLAPEIMADPTAWNSLGLGRRLNINFDNVGPGSMGFVADVHEFSAVPEVGTEVLAFTSVVVMAICRPMRHRRFYNCLS